MHSVTKHFNLKIDFFCYVTRRVDFLYYKILSNFNWRDDCSTYKKNMEIRYGDPIGKFIVPNSAQDTISDRLKTIEEKAIRWVMF